MTPPWEVGKPYQLHKYKFGKTFWIERPEDREQIVITKAFRGQPPPRLILLPTSSKLPTGHGLYSRGRPSTTTRPGETTSTVTSISSHEQNVTKDFTRDQNFWFQSTMLPELKVYNHGLSPLPMQNPSSKLILGIKSLFVNRFSKFLLHIFGQT